MNAPMERRALLLRGPGHGQGHGAAHGSCRAALAYAQNVFAALDRRMPEAVALATWLAQGADAFGLVDDALPELPQDRPRPRAGLPLDDWRRIGDAIAAAAEGAAGAAPDVTDQWVAAVGAALALAPAGRAVLDLALRYDTDLRVERLFDEMSTCRGAPDRLHRNPALFALLLALPQPDIAAQLESTAPLLAGGMLALTRNGVLQPLYGLTSLLRQDVPPEADIHGQLLGRLADPALPWTAFDHLGPETEVAVRVLRAALAGRERGVGILLHGAPGTGKTSFAAALAARVGAPLRPVGESGWDGDEPERGERLSALRLAHRLAIPGETLLLFDEAEDLFARRAMVGDEAVASSRVFVHRVLEQGAAPVIWTANDIGVLGPAVLRRMTMCIELRVPALPARARLWRSMGEAEGVALQDADAAHLARLVPAAPAVAAAALRATRLAAGDAATARLIVEGVARAVRGSALPPPEPLGDRYDPALLNADSDLDALVATLQRPGAPRDVSFLVSGPPGAGKSAWLRHLAAQIGLPVVQKRASDLLGAYVGESERNIAAAFAEARETESFLVFDEADSLLQERADAVRGWEVSQVNEMLTWMESHPLPFACTTNLIDRLDRASLRRFLFKLRFDWLTPAQARLAFRTLLGCPAPAALDALRTLTPSDFALVRRRAAVEDVATDPDALLRLLSQESKGRTGGRGALGFTAEPNRTP